MENNDELLTRLYYNPKTGLGSEQKLYEQAKEINPKITHKIVKEFLSNQESKQVFKPQKIKNYFPLQSHQPFDRLQIDILDCRNEAPRLNKGINYLFLCIDVYTRYVICIPMKTRTQKECLEALKTCIDQIESKGYVVFQIDSDNESAFTSKIFTKYCFDNKITQNLNEIGDHHALGIVDRFCKTIRGIIARYKEGFNTEKYEPVLQDLIENYNHTKHRTLGYSPEEMMKVPYTEVEQRQAKQIEKASQEQPVLQDIQLGSQVRLRIKSNLFDKKSSSNTFTKSIHTVTNIEQTQGQPLYYVNDRVNGYHKVDLQLIIKSSVNPIKQEEKTNVAAEEKEKKLTRAIKQEDLNIFDKKRSGKEEEKFNQPLPAKRERKPILYS